MKTKPKTATSLKICGFSVRQSGSSSHLLHCDKINFAKKIVLRSNQRGEDNKEGACMPVHWHL